MEAYLDNSATTRCLEEVTDKMVHIMREDYGNPSSMHMRGVEAEKYIKEYRAKERDDIRMARQARKNGNFYVPDEPKLAFVMRIRG